MHVSCVIEAAMRLAIASETCGTLRFMDMSENRILPQAMEAIALEWQKAGNSVCHLYGSQTPVLEQHRFWKEF